ncbi:SPOR domain-containing protein [Sphingomonas ginsenosidimutans]|uniref:SPOR domain-containing protein n=4 Tax=Sphingomonas TaxID=13687 RepID=UPI001DE0222D|nr:SPOR domain-containing protein [Sphingomonas ginsenosidimutans]MBY0302604.1 SPOR domain-containing protein [Sphingomonas ginsenosidimutans]
MKGSLVAALAAVAMLAPAVAAADVKAGVEAWSSGDYAKAVEQWRAPAAAGDADAQFNLGQAYKLGRGVPADQAQALEWFRKAAMQGHPQAEDNYGLSLFQNDRKADALPWLEKAVARDEKRAELVLGTMLFNGDAVSRDWTRAYALVTRSSQQGLPQGSQTLAQMDRYIPEDQRREGIAMAQQIEARGRAVQVAAAAPAPTAPAPKPAAPKPATPKPAATPTRPGASYSAPGGVTVPTAPKPVATSTAPAATPKPKPAAPAPKPAAKPAAKSAAKPAGGAWRIQLGAFRDAANARALWSQVGARVGGRADYVRAGGLTRLQATGFASRADAQRACTKAGIACSVVAP